MEDNIDKEGTVLEKSTVQVEEVREEVRETEAAVTPPEKKEKE